MKLAIAVCLVLPACAVSEDEAESTQELSNVPALTSATTTFTNAVSSATRSECTARGLATPTSVRTAYTPRNTLGVGPSGQTAVILVGTSFSVGSSTYGAGLYQLRQQSTGVMLYRFDPSGPTPLGFVGSSGPSPFINECYGVPDLLRSFCDSFVACALYDWNCPSLPPVHVG